MKHPKPHESGEAMHISHPHACTLPATWQDHAALATAIPGCPMPSTLNGIPFAPWIGPDDRETRMEDLTGHFEEPPFVPMRGFRIASGAVILERDGRVWLISPTNAFGGYVNTFPKGTLPGTDLSNLRANAVREAWEETGLKVRLTGFLCDCKRSTSVARYYLAERVGGTPADMGWESQAVHLVPREQLAGFAGHRNDRGILMALEKLGR